MRWGTQSGGSLRKVFAHRALGISIISLLMLVAAGMVLADLIEVDFEGYSLGTVDNQDGWQADGSVASSCAGMPYDVAVVDPDNYVNIDAFGDRSLRISNAVTSGCFGDQTFS